MKKDILDFYKEVSVYTNYGPYKEYFNSLTDNIYELAKFVNYQTIHRNTLFKSYKNNDEVSKKYPWYRLRCEDDILLTATSMMAELFRLDSNGISMNRKIEDKIVVTCRYVSVLMASILKAKGIPTRCRSGFCLIHNRYSEPRCGDHWIIQYFDSSKDRWINVDTNLISDLDLDLKYFDFEDNYFTSCAEAWINVRNGKYNEDYYIHGSGEHGLWMLARSLFYDFHALMNDEISYRFFPSFIDSNDKFNKLTENDLTELDELANLMLDPDKNFYKLKDIFDNNKKYRVLNSPLVGDANHLELDINN